MGRLLRTVSSPAFSRGRWRAGTSLKIGLSDGGETEGVPLNLNSKTFRRLMSGAAAAPPCISKRQRRGKIVAAVAESSPCAPMALKAVTELGTLSVLSVNPDSRSGRRVSPYLQGRETMETTRFVGIDVSKDRLDVCVRPEGETAMFVRDSEGIKALVDRMQQLAPEIVVLEATGGFEAMVVAALADSGIAVAVVNPRQIRDFARATGRLAKTDTLDAAAIAHFAEAIKPEPRPLLDEQAREFKALMVRRRELIDMIVRERNRFHQAVEKRVIKDLKAHLRFLELRLEAIDDDMTSTAPCARRRCGEPRRICCGQCRASGRKRRVHS